jgi:hypothetical protein
MIAPLGYLEAGFSEIPLRHRDKRPLIRWAEFQRRRPTEAEVRTWWRAAPKAGIAIVCGRVSSLVVLDEDPRIGGDASLAAFPFPPGPTVRTGTGGRHFYFAHTGEAIPKIPGLLPGVDLQAEKSYVVAPPSIHPNGTMYTWEPGRELGALPLPSLPPWLRRLIRDHRQDHGADGPHGPGAPLDVLAVLDRLDGAHQASGGEAGRRARKPGVARQGPGGEPPASAVILSPPTPRTAHPTPGGRSMTPSWLRQAPCPLGPDSRGRR